jgi:hypothetical protein
LSPLMAIIYKILHRHLLPTMRVQQWRRKQQQE